MKRRPSLAVPAAASSKGAGPFAASTLRRFKPPRVIAGGPALNNEAASGAKLTNEPAAQGTPDSAPSTALLQLDSPPGPTLPGPLKKPKLTRILFNSQPASILNSRVVTPPPPSSDNGDSSLKVPQEAFPINGCAVPGGTDVLDVLPHDQAVATSSIPTSPLTKPALKAAAQAHTPALLSPCASLEFNSQCSLGSIVSRLGKTPGSAVAARTAAGGSSTQSLHAAGYDPPVMTPLPAVAGSPVQSAPMLLSSSQALVAPVEGTAQAANSAQPRISQVEGHPAAQAASGHAEASAAAHPTPVEDCQSDWLQLPEPVPPPHKLQRQIQPFNIAASLFSDLCTSTCTQDVQTEEQQQTGLSRQTAPTTLPPFPVSQTALRLTWSTLRPQPAQQLPISLPGQTPVQHGALMLQWRQQLAVAAPVARAAHVLPRARLPRAHLPVRPAPVPASAGTPPTDHHMAEVDLVSLARVAAPVTPGVQCNPDMQEVTAESCREVTRTHAPAATHSHHHPPPPALTALLECQDEEFLAICHTPHLQLAQLLKPALTSTGTHLMATHQLSARSIHSDVIDWDHLMTCCTLSHAAGACSRMPVMMRDECQW